MKKTQDYYAYWRGWLLVLVGILLPLSALADEVTVADSNGNELRYTYDSADGPATFIGIKTYSADADKAGRIIIADRVTDANGVGHDVLYIGGSLNYRSNIVSVVFGKNIIATGGADGESSYAFESCRKLESVTLNTKLELLGSYTFQGCNKLVTINLSEVTSLKTIKKGCFYNADALKSITLPASVETLEESAVRNMDSLHTVTIPHGSQLQAVEKYAFANNPKLSSINLEAATQLKTLSDRCFSSCNALKSITIPASVEEFGSYILEYCSALETITFNASNVPDEFYNKYYYSDYPLHTINIGAGVKNIGKNAFAYIRQLVNLNISSDVSDLTIGPGAFYSSKGLESLTLPKGVTTIGKDAFRYIDSLRTVTIASGSQLQTVGEYAFAGNPKLSSINLEAATQLKTLSDRCFSSCNALKSITIPASVEEFGSYILEYCSALETITFNASNVPDEFYNKYYYSDYPLHTINIGAGVKNIGKNAFAYNRQLVNLNISTDVSDLTIGPGAFYNNRSLENLTLPKGVTTIGKEAFRYIDSLRTITIASGSQLQTIGEYAFADNSKLQSIELEKTTMLTAIPNGLLYACSQLTTITLPDAVQTVGSGAFNYTSSLTELICGKGLLSFSNDGSLFGYYNENLRKIVLPGTNYPFTGGHYLSGDIVLYVHPDLVDVYRSTNYTQNYRIVPIGQQSDYAVTTAAGGQLQSQLAEDLAQFTQSLTITGPINGTDINYLHSSFPNLQVLNLKNARIVAGGDKYYRWDVEQNGNAKAVTWDTWTTEDDVVGICMFYNMPSLQTLSLPEGTKKIGDYACGQNRRTNFRLTRIDIPSTVTEIGRDAFYYTGITEVTIPAGVTRIEQETFHDCRMLQRAVLPDGITFIGNSAFENCYELESVNIPAQVEIIEDDAFYNNYKRNTPVVIPNTCTTIGNYAFRYNKLLPSVTFGNSVQTVGRFAFADCYLIEQAVLPETVTRIGDRAFYNCDSLRTFTFPQNVKTVEGWVLESCDALTNVTLAQGTTSIGESAFYNCKKLTTINLAEQSVLTSLGNWAFTNTALTTVTLPNSITELGYGVFQGCTQLERVNIPTGVDYVPSDFCQDCPKLTSVTMHDGIRTIRSDAFYNCHILPTIDLNDQITTIDSWAFYNCDSLEVSNLPTALKKMGSGAFYNTSIKSASLPEGMTELGTEIFNSCKKLATVHLPKDIKSIPNSMFRYCKALEQIQIPDSVKEIGSCAFDQSGLTSVILPDSLEKLRYNAFSSTQLRSIRIPDGIKGDQPESYVFENCKHLKEAYLGRNQDYTTITSFTYFHSCDSLQLLRIYAGTPPKCNSYYMGYRKNCVLEVPEDAVDVYKETDVWKEFKEIKGYFDGDVLNDLDFAILKCLYRELDGQNWKKPWDLTNNHRSMGKWQGVVTVGDYITSIDLSAQGLKGVLPDSLFLLPRIETLNLSDNKIKADLTTLLANRSENTTLTEVNMMGNELTGDIYPFASKLPNLTKLDLSYNQLTAVSQPMSREKLDNYNFHRGFQFVDYQTKQVVEDAPVIDITPGIPVAIESNTLQTYRHEYGDYNFDFDGLYRHYLNANGDWTTSDWELTRNSDKLWTLYSDWSNRPLKAPKGVPVVYTHGQPWYSHLTYIIRFDWKDGDVNADQTVDVTDLQSVVNYALTDSKADGQMFNFTTADANSDDKINVSDIVGSVDYVLAYEETTPAQVPYYYNRAPASQQNTLAWDGNNIVLTHADAVAALQLTVAGAAMSQLHVSEALKSQFSVAMREVADGIRLVVWSTDGHTLMPGNHQLLTDLPVGAVVTDVRLSDVEARHLDVTNEGGTTSISILNSNFSVGDAPVFDLSGRRLGAWDSLPEGVYVIRVNGKQYKVKK